MQSTVRILPVAGSRAPKVHLTIFAHSDLRVPELGSIGEEEGKFGINFISLNIGTN